jgi:hypothetical protein
MYENKVSAVAFCCLIYINKTLIIFDAVEWENIIKLTWASAGEGKRGPLPYLDGQNSVFFD